LNQHKSLMSSQQHDEDTVMADQSLSPRGASTSRANHSAAQTAASSHTNIGVLTPDRLILI
jgi:hypothetical protein